MTTINSFEELVEKVARDTSFSHFDLIEFINHKAEQDGINIEPIAPFIAALALRLQWKEEFEALVLQADLKAAAEWVKKDKEKWAENEKRLLAENTPPEESVKEVISEIYE